MRRARAAGSDLTPAGAHLLAASGSESLWALAGEVEKLSTYVGRGGKIGPEEVRVLTPASHHSRVFDLTDALARRDHGRALALLHELLESGESPFGIVALTAAQTRSLIQIKVLSERGPKRRVAEIAQIAGIAPYVVEKSLPLARQFSLLELQATHRRLRDIDASLKRSKMTPEMALDLLVFEFGSQSGEE
jgi:DNA polymerase-3 subunit delta